MDAVNQDAAARSKMFQSHEMTIPLFFVSIGIFAVQQIDYFPLLQLEGALFPENKARGRCRFFILGVIVQITKHGFHIGFLCSDRALLYSKNIRIIATLPDNIPHMTFTLGPRGSLGRNVCTKQVISFNRNGELRRAYRSDISPFGPTHPVISPGTDKIVGLGRKAFNQNIGRRRFDFDALHGVHRGILRIFDTEPDNAGSIFPTHLHRRSVR